MKLPVHRYAKRVFTKTVAPLKSSGAVLNFIGAALNFTGAPVNLVVGGKISSAPVFFTGASVFLPFHR